MPRYLKPQYVALIVVWAVIIGCHSKPEYEVKTHTLAPSEIQNIPKYVKTIKETVAPEEWNTENSPHRISYDGDKITIRTTPSNQRAILEYTKRTLNI